MRETSWQRAAGGPAFSLDYRRPPVTRRRRAGDGLRRTISEQPTPL